MNDEFMLACTLSAYLGGARFCRWCNEPIGPRRYRWCSDECAKKAVSQHWWTEARRAALARDQQACTGGAGGHRGALQVHHIQPARGAHSKTSCVHHLDNLRTLCEAHHLDEHRAQRRTPGQLEIAS